MVSNFVRQSIVRLVPILFLVGIFIGGLQGNPANAATYAVCASGCDFTTLSDAFASSTSGDTITVGATYTSTTEAFPLTQPTGVTLDCQNSGAVIGSVTSTQQGLLVLTATTTVQNCSFADIKIRMDGSTIAVTNNSFITGYGSSTIASFPLSNTFNINVSGNLNLDGPIVLDTVTSGTIQGNTIIASSTEPLIFIFGLSSFVTVDGNIISDLASAPQTSNGWGIVQIKSIGAPLFKTATDITVSNNSVSALSLNSNIGVASLIAINGGTNIAVYGNNLIGSQNNSNLSLSGITVSSELVTSTVMLQNNTVKLMNSCKNCSGLSVQGWNYNSLSVTSTSNLFFADPLDSSSNKRGYAFLNLGGTLPYPLIFSSSYNGLLNFNTANASSTLTPLGTSDRTTGDPVFKIHDISSTNDFELASFSDFLDVNGTQDIGSYSAARGNSFHINAAGTIDYSSVDATTTSLLFSCLRSGDTVSIAAGNYPSSSLVSRALTASSTAFSTGLTLSGAGASTIFNGSSSTAGLSVTGLSSSSFTNFLTQNATSTPAPATYTMTKALYAYNGTDYDQSGAAGLPPNSALVIKAGCDIAPVSNDGDDVTEAVGSATNNWHLALLDFMGFKLTFWVPNDIASDAAGTESACGNMFTIDKFVSNVFTVSGGIFSYNASAVSSAGGVSLLPGLTAPPAITKHAAIYATLAGLKLINSSSNTITFVTSTNNNDALWFSGTSANNTVSSSTFSGNLAYDVSSDSSGTNDLRNVTYTVASSSVTGSGNVRGYFTARAFLQNSVATPLAGVSVALGDGAGSATSTLTTGSNGYTPYSSFLLAFVMTSSSSAVTAGGYNPYTILASATSTYVASSTQQNLISPNQTFSLTLVPSPVAPSGLTASVVSTSTIALAWTDNSSGLAQETNFLLDRINLSTGGSFPGTTSSIVQDTTTTSATSLSPNVQYQFRIASQNTAGTSGYSTSSALYTLANSPGTPSISSQTQTSLTLNLTTIANGNSVSTEFSIYNQTNASYLTTAGLSSASPVWATASTWGATLSATSLTCATSYSFIVIARNGNLVQTASSSAATGSTSACAVVSSGGGGGGGTSGGSGSGTPVVTTYQIFQNGQLITTSTPPEVPVISGISPSASRLAISAAQIAFNLENLKTLGISVNALLKLPDDGDLTTQEDSAVYYIGTDGRRHAFPNEKVFFTWYANFDQVQIVSKEVLAAIPLGPNVVYRSGKRLVKFRTLNPVYAVYPNSELRWVSTEALAIKLYGSNWNKLVDDIEDTFYTDYWFGAPLTD